MEVWNLVKPWGGYNGWAWIGGKALENDCDPIDKCFAWFDDIDRPTVCIEDFHSDPLKLQDPNQDYLRLVRNEWQDTEEQRQQDRICEFVQGETCARVYDYCTDYTSSWNHQYCGNIYKLQDNTKTCTKYGWGWQPTGVQLEDDAESLQLFNENGYCNEKTEFLFHGVCYSYLTTQTSWENSFDACRATGAVLAGYFHSCISAGALFWVNTQPQKDDFWISLRGYSGSGYHLDLDKDSCITIPSPGSVTVGSPLIDGTSSKTQHLHYLDGTVEYHSISDSKHVLCMKRECSVDQCQNGGVCFQDDNGNDKCSCPFGTIPPHCALDCDSNPCQNNGTCTETLIACGGGGYQCACPSLWTGTHCEQCDGANCYNGDCVVTGGSGAPMCICDPGWNGTDCNTNIDECESGPCLNDGSCNDGIDGYTCSCGSLYTGNHCETEITTTTTTITTTGPETTTVVPTTAAATTTNNIMTTTLLTTATILSTTTSRTTTSAAATTSTTTVIATTTSTSTITTVIATTTTTTSTSATVVTTSTTASSAAISPTSTTTMGHTSLLSSTTRTSTGSTTSSSMPSTAGPTSTINMQATTSTTASSTVALSTSATSVISSTTQAATSKIITATTKSSSSIFSTNAVLSSKRSSMISSESSSKTTVATDTSPTTTSLTTSKVVTSAATSFMSKAATTLTTATARSTATVSAATASSTIAAIIRTTERTATNSSIISSSTAPTPSKAELTSTSKSTTISSLKSSTTSEATRTTAAETISTTTTSGIASTTTSEASSTKTTSGTTSDTTGSTTGGKTSITTTSTETTRTTMPETTRTTMPETTRTTTSSSETASSKATTMATISTISKTRTTTVKSTLWFTTTSNGSKTPSTQLDDLTTSSTGTTTTISRTPSATRAEQSSSVFMPETSTTVSIRSTAGSTSDKEPKAKTTSSMIGTTTDDSTSFSTTLTDQKTSKPATEIPNKAGTTATTGTARTTMLTSKSLLPLHIKSTTISEKSMKTTMETVMKSTASTPRTSAITLVPSRVSSSLPTGFTTGRRPTTDFFAASTKVTKSETVSSIKRPKVTAPQVAAETMTFKQVESTTAMVMPTSNSLKSTTDIWTSEIPSSETTVLKNATTVTADLTTLQQRQTSSWESMSLPSTTSTTILLETSALMLTAKQNEISQKMTADGTESKPASLSVSNATGVVSLSSRVTTKMKPSIFATSQINATTLYSKSAKSSQAPRPKAKHTIKPSKATTMRPELNSEVYDLLHTIGIDDNTIETSDTISISSQVQDGMPYLLSQLDEETRIKMGHQLKESIPLCNYDGRPCDYEEY